MHNRIPGIVWGWLYLVLIFAMFAMGYHAGISGAARSYAVIALTLAFSVVVVLIVDLDRPQEGLVKVSQQALVDVRNSMLRSAR